MTAQIKVTPPRGGSPALARLEPFLVFAEAGTEEAARQALMAMLRCPEADKVAAIMGDSLETRGLAAHMMFLAGLPGGAVVSEQQVARTATKIETKARALLTEIQATDPELKALTVILRTSGKAEGHADMEQRFMDSLRALAYPEVDKELAQGAGRNSEGDRGTRGTFWLCRIWERVIGQPPQHAERSQFARVAMVLLPAFGVDVENWGDYLKRKIAARGSAVFYNVPAS